MLRIIQLVVLCLYPVSELLEKSVLLWKSALYDVTKGTDTSPRSVTRPTPCFQLLSDMFKTQGGCKQRVNPQKQIVEVISNWAPDLFNMSDRILHPTTRGLSFFFLVLLMSKKFYADVVRNIICVDSNKLQFFFEATFNDLKAWKLNGNRVVARNIASMFFFSHSSMTTPLIWDQLEWNLIELGRWVALSIWGSKTFAIEKN